MVSAPVVARTAASGVGEVRQSQRGAINIKPDGGGWSVRLQERCFRTANRVIQIKGIDLSELGRMLYVTNMDKPGFIGALGTLLGNAGVNIATFNLGRTCRRRTCALPGAGR